MKMIICIIQDSDKDVVTKALNDEGYRITVLPSKGAFFKRGNATLMIGVEDEKVDQVVSLIKKNTRKNDSPELKRATLFVINVDRFEQV